MDQFIKNSKSINYWRLISIVLFGWYFLGSAFNSQNWHFIDNVDLVIHEAGHWIFIFFGEFISVLGGSFLQVLIPVSFFVYFLIKRDYLSTSIISLWVGYNMVNVSVYMNDAVKMELPLLGGDSSIHDWNYLFSNLHLLNYSQFIASFCWGIGIFIIISGIIFGLKYSLVKD